MRRTIQGEVRGALHKPYGHEHGTEDAKELREAFAWLICVVL